MKIELKENILPVEIGNHRFNIDADDVNKHIVVEEFSLKYKGNRLITDNFIADCKQVINTLLGEGAYKKLFRKDDLKPYYVILQLSDALSDAFENSAITDKMRLQKESAEQELQKMQDILQGMNEFNNQLDYANKKYGLKHVANEKRSSGRNKNRNK